MLRRPSGSSRKRPSGKSYERCVTDRLKLNHFICGSSLFDQHFCSSPYFFLRLFIILLISCSPLKQNYIVQSISHGLVRLRRSRLVPLRQVLQNLLHFGVPERYVGAEIRRGLWMKARQCHGTHHDIVVLLQDVAVHVQLQEVLARFAVIQVVERIFS